MRALVVEVNTGDSPAGDIMGESVSLEDKELGT